MNEIRNETLKKLARNPHECLKTLTRFSYRRYFWPYYYTASVAPHRCMVAPHRCMIFYRSIQGRSFLWSPTLFVWSPLCYFDPSRTKSEMKLEKNSRHPHECLKTLTRFSGKKITEHLKLNPKGNQKESLNEILQKKLEIKHLRDVRPEIEILLFLFYSFVFDFKWKFKRRRWNRKKPEWIAARNPYVKYKMNSKEIIKIDLKKPEMKVCNWMQWKAMQCNAMQCKAM